MDIPHTYSNELISLDFWRLFHSVLRKGTRQEDEDHARRAFSWICDHLTTLRRVCVGIELELFGVVWELAMTDQRTPSYNLVEMKAERATKNEGMQEALKEYVQLRDDKAILDHDTPDFNALLGEMVKNYELEVLNLVLERTRIIANGAIEDKKTRKSLSGAKDAIAYLLERVHEGLTITVPKPKGGLLHENTDVVADMYERNQGAQHRGDLVISTGLAKLDRQFQFKRGELIGVLGYAGNRKSTLCRSVVYHAACMGFNVMHVTMEQTYHEELVTYALMHAHNGKWGGKYAGINKRDFDNGTFTAWQRSALYDVILPDLQAGLPGFIDIQQPHDCSWEAIKTMVTLRDGITPYDVLLVDYLTLVSVGKVYDQKAAREEIIKDAKQFALNFRDGAGLLLYTPVQGNRDGYEKALENGGQWDSTGIFQFSEYEKSADYILYVTSWNEGNGAVIGSCKERRGGKMAPIYLTINNNAGRFVPGGAEQAAGLDDLLDTI